MKRNREYLQQLQKRYGAAKKSERKTILTEFVKTTGYERQHAGKLLRKNYQYVSHVITRPRKRQYDIVDATILSKVCALLDWINSKRVKPAIGVAIDSLTAAGELTCSSEQRDKLMKISPSTIDRLFKTYRKRPTGKGISYTKPGTLLKHQIPIRTFADWNENKVGFTELDLVGHDGGLAKGDFGWTLDVVDVKSCWAEQIAVKNKAQVHVFSGLKTIRARLPFALLGIDSDGGSEFINNQLYRYSIQERITFTRGRAGKKNDQAHVEQKNDSIVRRWVGYGRYDSDEQIAVLNEFYEALRLYLNFFVPVMKLKEKVKIGSKIVKKYDTPKTPFQRILLAEDISEVVRNTLQTEYKTLNLVLLKRHIDAILKRLKLTPVG